MATDHLPVPLISPKPHVSLTPTFKSDDDLDAIREEIFKTALDYVRRGFYVIRDYGLIFVDGRLVCECRAGVRCKSPGKHPNLAPGWQHRVKAPSEQAVIEWWEKHPCSNVGIMGGDRWVIIDLDLPDGLDNWANVQELHGQAPPTLTVRSGSGGMHLYYLVPPGRSIGNTLPALKGLTNIDVRGVSGQVVAPPSLHVSGHQYEFVDDRDPVELPPWLFIPSNPPKPKKKRTPKANPLPTREPQPEKEFSDRAHERAEEWEDHVDDDAVLPQQIELKIGWGHKNANQSNFVFGIMLVAVAVHYSPDKLYDRLMDSGNGGGWTLRRRTHERGEEAAQEWFWRSWKKASLELAEHIATLEDIEAEVEARDWSGTIDFPNSNGEIERMRGGNLKKVLLVSIELGKKYTTTTPLLSKCKIAGLTQLDEKTVRKSFRGLIALGWMSIERPPKDKNPGIYRLHQP